MTSYSGLNGLTKLQNVFKSQSWSHQENVCIMSRQKTSTTIAYRYTRVCLDSLLRGAFTCHQESPLCTWLCHCRRYHSSLTHQTPATCSRRRYSRSSRCPLRRRSSKLSRCVQHEVWSKAEEMPLSSTYWCLRRNKSVGRIIYTQHFESEENKIKAVSVASQTHQCWKRVRPAGLRLHYNLRRLKSCCLKLEELCETWKGRNSHLCHVFRRNTKKDAVVQKGRSVHNMLPDGHVYHIPQGWLALYSPSRQWWHVSTLHSCVLHKSFPH